MQAVSPTFSGSAQASARNIATGVLVSWDKTVASGINYFKIGTSTIGGNDILKTTGGGTIAQAQQYKYVAIPASGIVSWSTDMSLSQFPYGLVQRQADVVLANASTQYLAASGTALGPYMISGRPVIIQAGFNSETIPMFTGYSDTPVNNINSRTTQLHCYDAVDYLNSYTSKTTLPQLNQRADQIIATLLAEAGFATNQYVLERSLNPTIPYLDPYNSMVGDVIGKLCEAEAAIFFADESGIMHFWNRQHFSNNATPVATLSYSNIESLEQQNTPILNYLDVRSSPLALVSGTKQVYSLNQPYYIQAAPPSGTNSITNPSFEVDASGWNNAVSTVMRDSSQHYMGSYSGKADGTARFALTSSGVTQSGVLSAAVYVKLTVSGNVPSVFLQDYSYNRVGSVTGNGVKGTGWQNIVMPKSSYSTTNGLLLSVDAGSLDYFYVDAATTDIVNPYYDGSGGPPYGNVSYVWNGTPGLSASQMVPTPQYLTFQASLNSDTYSLVQPTASGTGASMAANQSYYSFSTASGIGGIFGQDMTANVSLVSCTVSGSTAFLKFRNNSQNQAYLTNLVLYGQTAQPASIPIEQTYSDQTSIDAYRLNPANNGQIKTIANDYIPTPGAAAGLAQYLVQGYSVPHIMHTAGTFSRPELQFGDCVNLYNRDTGETRTGYIFGVSNSADGNGRFSQRLVIQERNLTNYFTIGTSSIGGATAIAP